MVVCVYIYIYIYPHRVPGPGGLAGTLNGGARPPGGLWAAPNVSGEPSDSRPGGPRRPPDTPKTAPRGVQWPTMRLKLPTRLPRRHKKLPRGLLRGPREANIGDFHLLLSMFFAFSLFRLSDAPRPPKRLPRPLQDGPRGPQESPKTAQESPKTAPDPPKTAQEGPKKAPRGAQEREHETTIRAFCPRAPQETPRGPQEPKRPPRGSPEAPKMPQNCPPETPESPPKRTQEASLRTLTHNPGTVAGWTEGH